MSELEVAATAAEGPSWRDYWSLCKPRVVALIVFTAIVGMFLATPGMVPLSVLLFGSLGIGLAAASAAAINHVVDANIDVLMKRTSNRPLPTGHLTARQALIFAVVLGVAGMLVLVFLVNGLTAILTFGALIGYAVVYTLFLKHATPQNIVIGGAAGAAPPVLGWVAVTGQLHPYALLLFLIVFVWTPPHFWALAIHRRDDYAKADVPMLPVTHGAAFTRLHVLLYTCLLLVVSLLPFAVGMSGLIYLVGALVLGGRFLWWAIHLYRTCEDSVALQTFNFSIIYLFLLFAVLLVDHYIWL
ncbi:MAG: heme o synthase [Gammaproteobacteria bacterium]|nr:heme o synthase [Gammaproteobacteria bacterium]